MSLFVVVAALVEAVLAAAAYLQYQLLRLKI
jgi:hypothetical protein